MSYTTIYIIASSYLLATCKATHTMVTLFTVFADLLPCFILYSGGRFYLCTSRRAEVPSEV